MKEFTGLLKSEIRKIEKFAQKRDSKDSQLTGYSYTQGTDELGFLTVTCEICSKGMTHREENVVLNVYMPDRRRSFVSLGKALPQE